METCYICKKKILDFDTVLDGIYLNVNGKFDTVLMCRECYRDLGKARVKNDVEFLKRKNKRIYPTSSKSKLYNKNNFNVGDIVYFIITTPISSAHPFVFNKQIEKGTIVAINIKITKDGVDYKYFIKHESDKCCRTHSNIFKTKKEAEAEL